ncbi:MAG: NAD(P)/FAD-dependent oxidoreductase [Oscillospiraceae bacterium]|nr:NAD(P)/FAD-dependent oxidoreductase [Oscillospiraceae bacterium]
MAQQKNAIIVGAGPAGLTAAYELLKNTDIHPIILEESGDIGGISRTAEYKGNRMDIGGHRFFSKNQQVVKLWEEIMPLQGVPSKDDLLLEREIPLQAGGPDPAETDRVMLVRHRVSRIFYLRKFFDYPISIKPATFINMGLVRTVKAGCGYLGSCVHKQKENSLEDFYINRFGRPLYEMFFEDYTKKLWGVHPSEIAPDWGAQRVKGLNIFKLLAAAVTKPFKKKDPTKVETSLIEQFSYPKYGPGQLYTTLASLVQEKGGEIIFNAAATRILTENNQVVGVETTDAQGAKTVYRGDYVISSMPVKDLVAAIDATVPQEVAQVAQELPYRDFITVGLLVDKLKIKNTTKMNTLREIVPDTWIYVQERDVKLGRLQIFNNWSPYMVKDFESKVWIGLEYFCSEGDELWSMSDEDFIKFAISEVEKIDIIEPNSVEDATRIRVKKAYPAYFGTYAQFDKVREYLDTYPNLFCVGRNGQHRYNNMDHSMLTAIEAVNCIKSGNTSKTALWNVNTEEAYHETTEEEA